MQRPLTADDLRSAGPLQRLGGHIHMRPETTSTNSFLLEHAATCIDGTLAFAEYQTAGRGRHKRIWQAPRGSSILLSVLLVERADSPLIPLAALLAALAAAEAVEAATTCQPSLRWPNDIVVESRKLGGVLAETSARESSPTATRNLVLGIGLNCYQQRGHFPPELAERATSLDLEASEPIDRVAVAAQLVHQLDALLSTPQLAAGDCDWLRSAWAERCEDIGQHVQLRENTREYSGTVVEIAENGDLIVQLDSGGRRHFESTTTTRIQ